MVMKMTAMVITAQRKENCLSISDEDDGDGDEDDGDSDHGKEEGNLLIIYHNWEIYWRNIFKLYTHFVKVPSSNFTHAL